VTVQEVQKDGYIGKRGEEVIVVMPSCFERDFHGTSMPFLMPDKRIMRIICDANKTAIFMDDDLLYGLYEAGNKEEGQRE
jgi:hypothetical protein